MALETLPEKLQLKEEKNLLIQGLPSSLEKQFIKLSFSKSVTPLLRNRKIDFALLFAISKKQLKEILEDVLPALHLEAKLWIAYPKVTSKIASDLSRDVNWEFIGGYGFSCVRAIALDNVWSAMRFKKPSDEKEESIAFSTKNPAPGVNYSERTVEIPGELAELLIEHKAAHTFFESLSFTNKREYVEWITGAKKDETKANRLITSLERLSAGKKNPSEK
jgi:Bacteriocin-protection, YdeI or OmpD-Associated